MDLDLFISDNKRFCSRCSAIIYNKDKTKVLLFAVPWRNFYMLPGGRINYMEDSASSIKREIKEELGLDLNYKLSSIKEIFLDNEDKKIMQYDFCYKAVYEGKTSEDKIYSLDSENQYFEWIDISELDKYDLKPFSAKHEIKTNEEVKIMIENAI